MEDNVKKLDLNAASFKQLLKHPYLKYEMVKEIINYRNNKKRYSDIMEILNLPGIDSITFYKVKPYLYISE
jgi:DNA uptake protein ComE-like DNA-binding protein